MLKYLDIVFTPGGSFAEVQNVLAGQAQKAIFKLNTYLYKLTYIRPNINLNFWQTYNFNIKLLVWNLAI